VRNYESEASIHDLYDLVTGFPIYASFDKYSYSDKYTCIDGTVYERHQD